MNATEDIRREINNWISKTVDIYVGPTDHLQEKEVSEETKSKIYQTVLPLMVDDVVVFTDRLKSKIES